MVFVLGLKWSSSFCCSDLFLLLNNILIKNASRKSVYNTHLRISIAFTTYGYKGDNVLLKNLLVIYFALYLLLVFLVVSHTLGNESSQLSSKKL